MPATKSFRSGTCASTLLPSSRSAWPCSRAIASAVAVPKKHTSRRNALLDRDLGDVCGRLDAEHRNAPRDEVLQQVTVVARDLHYPAVHIEPKPIAHLVDVAARVFDPARRVRREVRVLGEDLVWRDELLQLHQETRITHISMQRKERLHLLQLIGRDVRLAQGRHPEVDEGGLQGCTAEAAAETGPGRQE